MDLRSIRVLVAAAVLAIAACAGPASPPEEALRAWLVMAETAAEDKDRAALLRMISVDYADARGNDRQALDKILRWWFLRQKNIALLVNVDDIELYGDTAAQVTLTVGMAATNGNALGLSADAYRFELDMEQSDDEWFVIGARWGELGQELQ